MIQFQYMAPWVPSFNSAIDGESAANNGSPPFISFQFATVDKEGYPHNRTLVYRGFLFDDKSTNVITFTTDKRMDKYNELKANDKFEAVFYFGKLKKQFRLRGRARIIDDNYKPEIDLSSIQPKTILQNNINSGSSSSSDEDEEEEEEELSIKVSPSTSRSSSEIYKGVEIQKQPINYPLISPRLALQIQQDNHNLQISYTNLQDLSNLDYQPPTNQEWEQEIKRQWFNLSKNLKSTFRKPMPKTKMTLENQKLIDKISRGVDGKKEESGLSNFSCVGLFIDYVDFVEIEKDRRYIYKKDDHHYWSEEEVCP